MSPILKLQVLLLCSCKLLRNYPFCSRCALCPVHRTETKKKKHLTVHEIVFFTVHDADQFRVVGDLVLWLFVAAAFLQSVFVGVRLWKCVALETDYVVVFETDMNLSVLLAQQNMDRDLRLSLRSHSDRWDVEIDIAP